jgi:hypothetical protein
MTRHDGYDPRADAVRLLAEIYTAEADVHHRQEEAGVRPEDLDPLNDRLTTVLKAVLNQFPKNTRLFGLIEELERSKILLLFFEANPLDAGHLRINSELRRIMRLAETTTRRRLVLKFCLSAGPDDVWSEIMRVKPKIVHFSLHGEADGRLRFDDGRGNTEFLRPERLGMFFETLSKGVHRTRCVILNSCHSDVAAREILRSVDLVIGAAASIHDDAAAAFSEGFYSSLQESPGVAKAIERGKDAMQKLEHEVRRRGRPVTDPDGVNVYSADNLIVRVHDGLKLDEIEI